MPLTTMQVMERDAAQLQRRRDVVYVEIERLKREEVELDRRLKILRTAIDAMKSDLEPEVRMAEAVE